MPSQYSNTVQNLGNAQSMKKSEQFLKTSMNKMYINNLRVWIDFEDVVQTNDSLEIDINLI